MKGREIMGGILIANELVDGRSLNLKYVLCKIDLEKTSDRVDWGFLS